MIVHFEQQFKQWVGLMALIGIGRFQGASRSNDQV